MKETTVKITMKNNSPVLHITPPYLRGKSVSFGFFKAQRILQNLTSIQNFVAMNNRDATHFVCNSNYGDYYINYYEAYCILENINTIRKFVNEGTDDLIANDFEKYLDSKTQVRHDNDSLKDKMKNVGITVGDEYSDEEVIEPVDEDID